MARFALSAWIFCVSLSSLPLSAAPAKLCALYPHLKDSYWLSVNAGMVEQARARGVMLKTFEAGGY